MVDVGTVDTIASQKTQLEELQKQQGHTCEAVRWLIKYMAHRYAEVLLCNIEPEVSS